MSARWKRYARHALAKQNDGAPGEDGVTFEAIETQGVDAFLEQIQDELNDRTYVPLPARKQEIPKDGGKVRVLSIGDPGSSGARGSQAHTGADLRGRLPTGIVWISSQAYSS